MEFALLAVIELRDVVGEINADIQLLLDTIQDQQTVRSQYGTQVSLSFYCLSKEGFGVVQWRYAERHDKAETLFHTGCKLSNHPKLKPYNS